MLSLLLPLLLLCATGLAQVNTWCGKVYQPGDPLEPLPMDSYFVAPPPPASGQTFRCAAAEKPYIVGGDKNGAVIVSVNGSTPAGTTPPTIAVQVYIDNVRVVSGNISYGPSIARLEFPLASLQSGPHDLMCKANLTLDSAVLNLEATSKLYLQPPNLSGGVVKMDAQTGALLPLQTSIRQPIFPFGFYVYDTTIAGNLSILNDMQGMGINVVHVVPVATAYDFAKLTMIANKMDELGLFLVFDMRYTYQNITSVTEQVNAFKNLTNLLLWYTGDEPDGTHDPVNSTTAAYSAINSLDGYHPVGLVLNCDNFFFSQYSAGCDIIMQDTYPIGINSTFSASHHTPCNTTYGDCGCDNCHGNLQDIADRMDQFNYRLSAEGRQWSTAVWTVPQAFSGSGYWPDAPTGPEYIAQNILSINHGAKGSIAWSWDDTNAAIRDVLPAFGKALPSITKFVLSVNASFTPQSQGGVDIGAWTLAQGGLDIGNWTQDHDLATTLVLAVNLNSTAQNVTIQPPPGSPPVSWAVNTSLPLVAAADANVDAATKALVVNLQPLQSVAFIMQHI